MRAIPSLLLALAGGAAACRAQQPATSVRVTPASVMLAVGERVQLGAEALDAGGDTISRPAFTWSSSNPQVATVSPAGLVTAVATGRAGITATLNGRWSTSVLTVVPPATAQSPVGTEAARSLAAADTIASAPPRRRAPAPAAAAPSAPSARSASARTGGSAPPATPGRGTGRGTAAAHEPPGLHRYTNRDFGSRARTATDAAHAQGWWAMEGRYDRLALIDDPSAPVGSPIIRYTFPAGMASGVGPAQTRYEFPSGSAPEKTVYISTWVRYSPNFEGGLVKLYYVNWTGGSIILMAHSPSPTGAMSLSVFTNHGDFKIGNIYSRTPVARGEWHNVELLLGLSSAPNVPDGVVQLWIDGRQVVDRANLPIPGTGPFTEVRFSPIYGGFKGVPVPAMQYLDIDNVYISGR